MVGDNSAGSGHAHGEALVMEVLRAGLLTQETTLRGLADSVECRFQAFERRSDEIANQLDALALYSNRDRIDDRRRPRADNLQGQPINRPVLRITSDNLSTVMSWKRRKTSFLAIISPQKAVEDMGVIMREMVEVSDCR